MTLKITLITAVLAVVLSFVIGFLRLVPNPWIRRLVTAYVEILRGTSAIVQLFYLFFILPAFGISLPPTATAVIGLGLNLSAYGSEIVRAGILSIGEGQHEGAAALGLDRVQTYRLVILPQALVSMLPSFGNLLIDLVKATSLVSLITITELTFSGRQMVVTTGRSVEVWTLVLLLYFVFYVLPAYGIRFPALTTGILCLGLHIGAYIAEVYRAGIDAVPVGQWEAARALGLRSLPLWSRVILPQALPPMIPPLGNFLIGLFKETPLLAAITVVDVFGAANNVAGLNYRYNEPYTAVAVILLTISLIAAYFVRKLERRYSPGQTRRRTPKKV